MSSAPRVQVKLVRIQWPDQKQPINYDNNVAISMPKDNVTGTLYLRIIANQKVVLAEELTNFKWLDECSVQGVATVKSSSSVVIVMIYNAKDRMSNDLFNEMQSYLEQVHERVAPNPTKNKGNQPRQDDTELATNDLINSIQNSSYTKAEAAVKYLAGNSENIQFELLDPDHNKVNVTKPETNVLQLTLRIECHLNREPIISQISVDPGTTLRTLKGEIEERTGIDRRNQYWYAFDRFIIDDDYKFGSNEPVVPPRKHAVPRNQAPLPTVPIQSGDTLILYIAQIQPYN